MFKTDAEGAGSRGEGRGQGNFELSINSDYIHEGQLTLAKSLRRCRISKLPLTAHKVLQTPNRCRLFRVRLEKNKNFKFISTPS